MEVSETEVRILLYESLRNEWFPHTSLVLDPTQKGYWAAEAIQEAYLPLTTSEELALSGTPGSSGDQQLSNPEEAQETHDVNQPSNVFPPELPLSMPQLQHEAEAR